MAKQKLSAEARRRKAVRDLKYANSARRKRMRAENQRLRRAAVKAGKKIDGKDYDHNTCLLYTSPSPRDRQKSRMPSSA